MRRLLVILTLILPWIAVAAEESFGAERDTTRQQQQLTWRIFTKLSQKEREEMLELLFTDQDKYKKVMQQRVDTQRQLEQAKREELRGIYEEWKNASADQKAEIRKNLEQKVRTEYEVRLADNRKQLEDMQKRAVELEKELNKRETDTDNQVKMRVENILKGKIGPAKEDRDNKIKDKNK